VKPETQNPKYIYKWTTLYDRFYTYRDGIVMENRLPNQAHLCVNGCQAFAMKTDARVMQAELEKINLGPSNNERRLVVISFLFNGKIRTEGDRYTLLKNMG
jgi:hypothetical protein